MQIRDAIQSEVKRLSFALKWLLGFLALGQLQAAALQSVTLAWDPSPDPSVAGYYVYYGGTSGTYTNKVNAANATTATVPNLAEGATYYFAVTAYNSSGLESPPSNEVSYSVPDQPAIILTAPANGASYTAPATITLSAGITANGHTITQVQFYNGSTLLGSDTKAPYTLAWNCANSGAYTLSARLVYDGGSTLNSAAATVQVKPSAPTNPHVITVVGNGTVSPDLNSQPLVVGNRYTVKAVPADGQQFAGWSGSLASVSPTISFLMTPGVSLQARFVPFPNGGVAASYYGLFYESNQVEQSSSGSFLLSTTKRGGYSGYLQIGKTRLPFHGQLDPEGHGTNTLVCPDQSTLALRFSLAGGAPADQLQGTLTATNWVAGLLGDRSVFTPKANPAPLQGAYTLIIPGPKASDPAQPFGHSFGLVKVDASGHVRLSASLADGTRLTQSAPLSSRGAWGLYAPLYGGQGSVLSWLTFTNRPTDDFNGALSWIKPASPNDRRYPGGFTNDCQALGSAFTPPAPADPLGINGEDATLSFAGGQLTAASINTVAGTASGRLDCQGTNRPRLSVSRTTGAFRGSGCFSSTGKPLPFAGVLFQKTRTGYGFLLNLGQSSQVELAPSAP